MKQVCIHGPGDVRIDDVAAPEPGPRDVVVRVTACGICGSDLSYIKMGGVGMTSPMPLGHEMAGVVDQVGSEVSVARVGDRVVVKPGNLDGTDTGIIGNGGPEGGLTPSLLVTDADRGPRLYRISDDLSLEVAALAEPVAVGMQSANRTDAQRGEKAAVFGCGPIGLAAIATLVDRGVDVVGIDLSARRLELAGELGASAVLDPTAVDVWEELTRLHGIAPALFGATPGTDVFVEASGSNEALGSILDRCRTSARVSVVALHPEPLPVNFMSVMSKRLQIRGSMGYPARFEDAIDLLSRRDVGAMITHRLPLEQFHDALAVLDADKNCGKVLVTVDAGA